MREKNEPPYFPWLESPSMHKLQHFYSTMRDNDYTTRKLGKDTG